MDTGSDFIRPEFFNILFVQQKNLVVFPYVDFRHLKALEVFAEGFAVVDLDSTMLNSIKEIIESEADNSYSQNRLFFFISNVGKKQLQEIMSLKNVRCVINSNEDTSGLVNGSRFIFFNKKHGQFVNFEIEEKQLEFEKELITKYDNESLQEQVHQIKIMASKIYREINNTGNLDEISEILSTYDKSQKYWNSILTFTGNYYEINVPNIKDLEVKAKPKKILKDFSNEYEILITTNKPIGREFVQQLYEYSHRKVNAQHLKLKELHNPLLLYNYLRNHHWNKGIPEDFISVWNKMEISGYTLTEVDQEDFTLILEKLHIPQRKLTPPPSKKTNLSGPLSIKSKSLTNNNLIPLLHSNFKQFRKQLLSQVDNIGNTVSNVLKRSPENTNDPKLLALTSFIRNEVSELNCMLEPYRNMGSHKQKSEQNIQKIEQDNGILVIDVTNILSLDKNEEGNIKISNIPKLHDAVRELGYTPKMWADASMRHHVDEKELYEELLDRKVVIQCPAGTKADIWVLKIAKKRNYKFLANDLYRGYRDEFGFEWISKNRFTCVYDEGEFIIQESM